MSEVSWPWENKSVGLQKEGEQKKCYGFQQQNNLFEGRKEAWRHAERGCINYSSHVTVRTGLPCICSCQLVCLCKADTRKISGFQLTNFLYCME